MVPSSRQRRIPHKIGQYASRRHPLALLVGLSVDLVSKGLVKTGELAPADAERGKALIVVGARSLLLGAKAEEVNSTS